MFSKAAEPLYIPNRALDSFGMLSHLPSKTFYYPWYPTLYVCVCVCVCVCISESHSVMSDSLQPHGMQPTRLLCPWNSAGKNTEVGGCSLLQEIFLTQGLNPGLPHCRWILYHLGHQGIPCIWQPLIFFSPLISLLALCCWWSSDFCLNYPLLVSTSLNNLIQPGDFKYPLFRMSLKAQLHF